MLRVRAISCLHSSALPSPPNLDSCAEVHASSSRLVQEWAVDTRDFFPRLVPLSTGAACTSWSDIHDAGGCGSSAPPGETCQRDRAARKLRARRLCLALIWFDELLTAAALGDVCVLCGMRRAHAELHRVIVHASLMAPRRTVDCTLGFLIRVQRRHCAKSLARPQLSCLASIRRTQGSRPIISMGT